MDKWNPIEDDYKDKQFNSYDRGPGKNISKDRDKFSGQQLYITGIPKDLSDSGLENLFSRAGVVLRANVVTSKKPNSRDTFGFVTMENLIQAEDAIRQLNNFKMGEFTLKVKIAMSEEEKAKRKQKQMEEESILNSLPSARKIVLKGSDSDSDRGSVHSGSSRPPNTNGYTSDSRSKFDKPGILGAYPHRRNDNFNFQSSGTALMNERFIELEQHSGGYYQGENRRGRERGIGRGMPNTYQAGGFNGYGRGMPQERFNAGYGRGGPYNAERYNRYGNDFYDEYRAGYRDQQQMASFGRGAGYQMSIRVRLRYRTRPL